MNQESGDSRILETRKNRIVRKIIGRVDRGGELSPALRKVLQKLGEQSERDVAVDAAREEGFELDSQTLKEAPESERR